MTDDPDGRPIVGTRDPYAETNVSYAVVNTDSMSPDIVEVDKGTPGSFSTLQQAKSHAMQLVRDRIAEGSKSLDRLRAIGVDIPRHM